MGLMPHYYCHRFYSCDDVYGVEHPDPKCLTSYATSSALKEHVSFTFSTLKVFGHGEQAMIGVHNAAAHGAPWA